MVLWQVGGLQSAMWDLSSATKGKIILLKSTRFLLPVIFYTKSIACLIKIINKANIWAEILVLIQSTNLSPKVDRMFFTNTIAANV